MTVYRGNSIAIELCENYDLGDIVFDRDGTRLWRIKGKLIGQK